MDVGGDVARGAIDAPLAARAQHPGDGVDPRVSALPGVGPRTAARLRARGLATIGELLFHLPRAYDDLRRVVRIADLTAAAEGRVVLVRGRVARVRVFPRRLLDVTVVEDGVTLRARWFRPPRGMEKGFSKGEDILLAGPLRSIGEGAAAGGFEVVQPSVHRQGTDAGDGQGGLGVRPRYPIVEGVNGRVLEKIIAAAVDRHAGEVAELLDPAARDRLGLPTAREALCAVHARAGDPTDDELSALAAARSPAHRRLAFDELLVLQLGLATTRQQLRSCPAVACAGGGAGAGADLVARATACAALPFALTAGQAGAIDDIARDLSAPHPMQRLLVGDVGSGKTAVAFLAAAMVAASGGQTLFMAPTEVLVEQHLRTIGTWARGLGLGVARFTAGMARAERAQTLARCQAGEVQILIGTQALLDARPALALPDLRLAIVDEQHRFGVAQRARLRAPVAGAPGARNAGVVPHLLVMSATPIPRTLALTLYGDLDATFLRESPPGRHPIATQICAGVEGRRAAYQRLRDVVREGRQAYVVCPVRERATRAGAITAVRRAAELRRELGPAGIRVGLLHGDLDAVDKDGLLRRFADGGIDVLVATTVVELGLDVPNAAVMLIEEADRFGLSQLHQLRGRVGRGTCAGTCLLCPAAGVADGTDAARRLAELVATQDGFQIAEADLALRGPGDLYGERQAGAPRLRWGTLADQSDLVEQARGEAVRIAAADPTLDLAPHRALRAAVGARWAARAVFAEDSG